MSIPAINSIFETLYKISHEEGQQEFVTILKQNLPQNAILNITDQENTSTSFDLQKQFLQKIINEIDCLAVELQKNNSILISIRNQKVLQTCFQLVASLGMASCLIPGLGISLTKRCSPTTASVLPTIHLTDDQKYELLTVCTDFYTRSYEVPAFMKIIVTLNFSDYIAALIQLSFAPLKKPGVYENFTMTQELYDQLIFDRQKYQHVYENLVSKSFQPMIMRELLVLQGMTDPCPPAFLKKVVGREMSRRLLMPKGLLSLIRCFFESYDTDMGSEWKKICMICNIIAEKHGKGTIEEYLKNMTDQIKEILTSKNAFHLTTAVSCLLTLAGKYPDNNHVSMLQNEALGALNYKTLFSKSNLPGTITLSPQEVEEKVNVIHACVCSTKLKWPVTLISANMYMIFQLGVKCIQNEDMKVKLRDTILNYLEALSKEEICSTMTLFILGYDCSEFPGIEIEEYEAGLAIKCISTHLEHSKSDEVNYILYLFKSAADGYLVRTMFESSLQILDNLTSKRQKKSKEISVNNKDDVVFLEEVDEQYAYILQLLSEICTYPRVVFLLKNDPSIVIPFIERFILMDQTDSNNECITIALVLLNTILLNSNNPKSSQERLAKLVPRLSIMSENNSSYSILCEEALSLLSSDEPHIQWSDTACGKAISDVFNGLLPVRAHGIIELTKLIDNQDPETISKKHYIFCLLQEQLRDPDSYIYLSTINGIAALGVHCTEDVLQILCQEFLRVSNEQKSDEIMDDEKKFAELRMKTGDIIVKVTRGLGEMAVVHKTLLLNTMLCGCRDEDPLIRTSALSNLAEIAQVLHYRIGTIIYEVLLCVWSIIESDKAIECRRAAVMVISSLLKGLGKEALLQLSDNLLPIYRTLRDLENDLTEDSIMRLHAQIGLNELNDIVNQYFTPDFNPKPLQPCLNKEIRFK